MSPLNEKDKRKISKIIHALEDKKGQNVVLMDLRDHSIATDYFIITHGDNPKHVRAIAQNVMEKLEEKPRHKEGIGESNWVAMDYGDVWIHIFQEETRNFYDLEGLRADRKISFEESKTKS